jgi:hypothetical protein
MRVLDRILHRREAEEAHTPFRRIAERELAFLEHEQGFDTPEWEPFPHAEEMLTYRRGQAQIRVHLGDGARGIDLELLSAGGRLEHLQIEDWLHRDDAPWGVETERILAAYAHLLRARPADLEEPGSD